MSKAQFIQVVGFLVVVIVIWRFVGAEAAALMATAVAVWEYLRPSRKD